jgi:hypothetical protein
LSFLVCSCRAAVGGGLALIFAALALVAGGCAATPPPKVLRAPVSRAPGESIILARVQIPAAISGVSGAVPPDAVRVTIQTEGAQAVRPTPLTPAGYLLASLPPGSYRLASWESRVAQVSRFGPLDVPFEVPLPDKFYYLGTLVLVGQTTERYVLVVGDHLDEAMRYLTAEQPRLAGSYERRLLVIPSR